MPDISNPTEYFEWLVKEYGIGGARKVILAMPPELREKLYDVALEVFVSEESRERYEKKKRVLKRLKKKMREEKRTETAEKMHIEYDPYEDVYEIETAYD